MAITYEGTIFRALDAHDAEYRAWTIEPIDGPDGTRCIVHDLNRQTSPSIRSNTPETVSFTKDVFASKDAAKQFVRYQAMKAALESGK